MMKANERIRKLLDRVGYHPVRFKNNVESKEMRRDHLLQFIKDRYDGDALEMIDDLTETVNDLECALENMANKYMPASKDRTDPIEKARHNGWLSGFDFSILMQDFLISDGGYVLDTGNWENVNAEVALRLEERIRKHPVLWKFFFMVG